MATQQHIEKIKQGSDIWNQWRKNNPKIIPDLIEARLFNMNLDCYNFNDANLVSATLSNSSLINATFKKSLLQGARLRLCDLEEAIFEQAHLAEANLYSANLSKANLSKAILINTNFNNTVLNEAIFNESCMGGTNLLYIDLSKCIGLERIIHFSPSNISIDTFYKSNGNIPHLFLKKIGVPPSFIEKIKEIIDIAQPNEFYSCFISYSHRNAEFINQLHTDLIKNGIRCWCAAQDMKPGEKIYDQIDAAIKDYDRLIIVLSDNSMKSEWVKTEIAKARKKEKETGKRILFPISIVDFKVIKKWECFDADIGKDSAKEIREYYIPNFKNWKDHNEYMKELVRLIESLKSVDLKEK